jgi:hypothetical protein
METEQARLLQEIDEIKEQTRQLVFEAQESGRLSTEYLMLCQMLRQRYAELESIQESA